MEEETSLKTDRDIEATTKSKEIPNEYIYFYLCK